MFSRKNTMDLVNRI